MMKRPKPESSGLTGPYYAFPPNSLELQDVINDKDMSYNRGNIFKAAMRWGAKDDSPTYDIEKCVYFAIEALVEEVGFSTALAKIDTVLARHRKREKGRTSLSLPQPPPEGTGKVSMEGDLTDINGYVATPHLRDR